MTGASPGPPRRAIDVADAPPDSLVAERALRAYLVDVASRYYGRSPTDVEMEDALRAHPSDELAPPTGAYLVATGADGVPVGSVASCASPTAWGRHAGSTSWPHTVGVAWDVG